MAAGLGQVVALARAGVLGQGPGTSAAQAADAEPWLPGPLGAVPGWEAPTGARPVPCPFTPPPTAAPGAVGCPPDREWMSEAVCDMACCGSGVSAITPAATTKAAMASTAAGRSRHGLGRACPGAGPRTRREGIATTRRPPTRRQPCAGPRRRRRPSPRRRAAAAAWSAGPGSGPGHCRAGSTEPAAACSARRRISSRSRSRWVIPGSPGGWGHASCRTTLPPPPIHPGPVRRRASLFRVRPRRANVQSRQSQSGRYSRRVPGRGGFRPGTGGHAWPLIAVFWRRLFQAERRVVVHRVVRLNEHVGQLRVPV